jgi:hypothetical protein
MVRRGHRLKFVENGQSLCYAVLQICGIDMELAGL